MSQSSPYYCMWYSAITKVYRAAEVRNRQVQIDDFLYFRIFVNMQNYLLYSLVRSDCIDKYLRIVIS